MPDAIFPDGLWLARSLLGIPTAARQVDLCIDPRQNLASIATDRRDGTIA